MYHSSKYISYLIRIPVFLLLPLRSLQMRYEEQQRLQQYQRDEGSGLSSDEIRQQDARLSLIDTTLLKCYIKVCVLCVCVCVCMLCV